MYKKISTVAFERFNKYILKRNRVEAEEWEIKGPIYLRNHGTIEIDDGLKVNSGFLYNPVGGGLGTAIIVGKGARLVIGKNVGISNSIIICRSEIVIENDVMIGGNSRILDSNFHPLSFQKRKEGGAESFEKKKLRIGEGAFIGANSTILKGARIGPRAVIGACSVVRSAVPSEEVWVGNPAVFLKKL